MRVVSTRAGRAVNGPSQTTVVQFTSSSELVVLQVVTEADSYEPQCRVEVRALDTGKNTWSSCLVSRTAERTYRLKSDLMAGRLHLSNEPDAYQLALDAAMVNDEQEALADALAILNASRLEDLT